jgi:AcrR family transcriptional regulator
VPQKRNTGGETAAAPTPRARSNAPESGVPKADRSGADASAPTRAAKATKAASTPVKVPMSKTLGELGTPRSTQRAGKREATRAALLDAALLEFSERGFDGVSTREIAARAGAHHALIKYYFNTKEELWRAGVTFLFERQLLELTIPDLATRTRHDRRAFAREVLRQVVLYSARRPEHSRLMVQESCRDSERFRWSADAYITRLSHAAGDFITAMQREGVFPPGAVQPMVYMLVGASQLFYALAPEVRRVWGVDPADPQMVEEHARAMISLFVREA